MFLALPVAVLLAFGLIVFGWGDRPDVPPGYDEYAWKVVFGLAAVGIVVGIAMRVTQRSCRPASKDGA
jgi:hypothetical protein